LSDTSVWVRCKIKRKGRGRGKIGAKGTSDEEAGKQKVEETRGTVGYKKGVSRFGCGFTWNQKEKN